MLSIHTAGRIEPLVDHLAGVLSVAPPGAGDGWDTMAPEWIAVPSEGMRRWLHLELARRLGAGPLGGDGVVANVVAAFPDTLRRRVMAAAPSTDHAGPGADPWQVEPLAWSVLAELHLASTSSADTSLTAVATVPKGASLQARARRIADLFDRYHVHRADMVRQWALGHDVDGTGRPLVAHHRWQPELWRRVRARIDRPSPPEQLRHLLDELLEGRLELTIDDRSGRPMPQRLALFGLSALPGGVSFLDLADAVATQRDVHLYLVEPSPDAARRLAASVTPQPESARLRADDTTAAQIHHPLLRSWGRLHRETTVVLADAEGQGLAPVQRLDAVDSPAAGAAAATLLGRLQADLRADRAPVADLVPAQHDHTIRLHAAHGAARQVEVLRDVVLHLLDDDQLDLTEDDIVVLSPALDQLAPVIEAVLGPSVDAAPTHRTGTPGLRYRIADRSLRRATPLLDALDRVLALVAGRFDIASVLDLVALVPVRSRFGFSDDDVARIGEWAVQSNVRWGLDEQQRARHGLPAEFDTNTWRAAIDRLMLGVAVSGVDQLGVGDVVALPVDGSDAALAGRLAELLWRLEQLADAAGTARPLHEWLQLVRGAVDQLLAVDRDEAWQMDRLTQVLADVAEHAELEPASADLPLAFVDLRRVLGEHLGATAGRADFFRGGLTISSMTPLRGVPYRVVILLGVDQPAFSVGAPDGDDLSAAAPQLGDRDRRGESRQALLDAVLATRDQLVLIRDGADVRTNQRIPRAVPVAELVDAVLATVHPDHVERVAGQLEVDHPRQAFDDACFAPGRVQPERSWSFDVIAHQGALARRTRRSGTQQFLTRPLAPVPTPVVELADLHRFLREPVAHFVQQRLGLRFPDRRESPSLLVPLDLTGLDRYDVGSRLFAWRLAGGDRAEWERVERRRGTLGPGSLAEASLDEVDTIAAALVDAAQTAGVRTDRVETLPIDLTLPGGTRVVGTVTDLLDGRPGPARLTYSGARPAHVVAAWLDLVALVASDPTVPWRSVSIAKHPTRATATALQLEAVQSDDAEQRRRAAIGGLAVAVDCYLRGRCEPLPLFPAVSFELANGERGDASWRGYKWGGDGTSESARLVYGEADLRELRREPRRDGDPLTAAGADADRLLCYAEYLWHAIGASANQVELVAS